MNAALKSAGYEVTLDVKETDADKDKEELKKLTRTVEDLRAELDNVKDGRNESERVIKECNDAMKKLTKESSF